MTRLIGILIIMFGAIFALLGVLALAAVVKAIATAAPPSPAGNGGGVFLSIGAAAIGYGWRCVKGFDEQGPGKRKKRQAEPIPPDK